MKTAFTQIKTIGFLIPSLLFHVAHAQNVLKLRPGAEGKDAMIFSIPKYKDVNYGSTEHLHVCAWTWNGVAGAQRSLIQFDLSQVPVGAEVASAKLVLHADGFQSENINGHSNYSKSNASYLKRVLAPWEEDKITWANQPTYEDKPIAVLPQSTLSTQDYSLDVTADVIDMIKEPKSNYGFMIQLQKEEQYAGLFFATSDAENERLHPELVIEYKSCVATLSLQPDGSGKDASVFSLEPTTNYGDYTNFTSWGWTWNGVEGIYRSLIQFDLTSIPKEATVSEATLNLYANNYKSLNLEGHSNYSASNASQLKTILTPWEENTVTWNKQPEYNNLDVVLLSKSTSSTQDYVLNVAKQVQKMVGDPKSNFGFMLSLQKETHHAGLFFGSSDDKEPSRRPKLTVKYTKPCVVTEVEKEVVAGNAMYVVNPTSASKAELSYYLRTSAFVTMTMTSIDGLETHLLVNEKLVAGAQRVSLRGVRAGLYVLRTSLDGHIRVEKLVVTE